MARFIEEEAWDHAPKALTPLAYLALLRLADSAGRDHRMVWISVKTLMRYTRAGRATVYRALLQLAEFNIVVEVPREEWPPEAARYDSVVRKISPVSEWKWIFDGDKDVPGELVNPGPVGTTSSPADSHFETKIDSHFETGGVSFWDPNQEPINQELDREKTSSSLRDRQGGPRKSGTSGSSSRSQVEDSDHAPVDDDHDPESFVDPDPEPPAPPARWSGDPGPDTGRGLAAHFINVIRGSGLAAVPHPANQKKLAGVLNDWKRQGLQPDRIRSMMEQYAKSSALRGGSNYPSWRDFVYKRAQILAAMQVEADLEFQDKVMNDPDSQEYQDYWGDSADYFMPRLGDSQ